MENLYIIFGGASVEHDVSIVTALQTYNTLKHKYNITLIYCSKDNELYLTTKSTPADYIDKDALIKDAKKVTLYNKGLYLVAKKKLRFLASVERVINCCHGGIGENGSLSALLNFNNVANTSASFSASAVCMDKHITKLVANYLNIPIVKYEVLNRTIKKDIDVDMLGDNLIVKPCGLGSSIGVVRSDKEHLKENIDVVLHLDDKVLIEREISPLVEYNCAIVRDGDNLIVSQIEQPINRSDILSFEDKYINTDKTRILPADISEEKQNIIYEYTKRIYQYLDLNGVVRIDYLYDTDQDVIYLNEINTIPGSMAYYLFEGLGISYVKLMDILIKNAKVKPLQPYFNSNILTNLKEIGK